jgi:DNA-binding transcriptional regulator YiaG
MSEIGQTGIRAECMQDAANWEPPSTEEIRLLMDSLGLSPRDVADYLGVSRKSVNRWTIGQESIPFASWVLLCRKSGWGYAAY